MRGSETSRLKHWRRPGGLGAYYKANGGSEPFFFGVRGEHNQ